MYFRSVAFFSSGRKEDVNFSGTLVVFRGPFFERPGNISPSGPKVIFKITENLLSSKTVPSSQTSQFAQFHCIIFKIIETLISSKNTANIKQLSGPEMLSGLSRNGPLEASLSQTLPHHVLSDAGYQ